jgi:hypothetical protein
MISRFAGQERTTAQEQKSPVAAPGACLRCDEMCMRFDQTRQRKIGKGAALFAFSFASVRNASNFLRAILRCNYEIVSIFICDAGARMESGRAVLATAHCGARRNVRQKTVKG